MSQKNKNQTSADSIEFNSDPGLYDIYDDAKDKVVQSFSNIKDAVKKEVKTNFPNK